MLSVFLRSRTVARVAIGGLAVGVSALAGLALWNTSDTASTTAKVSSVNRTSSEWTQLLLHFSDEYEALNDYLRADTDLGRQPLSSSVGSADAVLRSMLEHSSGRPGPRWIRWPTAIGRTPSR